MYFAFTICDIIYTNNKESKNKMNKTFLCFIAYTI